MVALSVIIPIGPDERRAGRLIADLLLLPNDTELLFVTCCAPERFAPRATIDRLLIGYPVRWLQAARGRAVQQNAGAAAATGRVLWFLHWDSGFGPLLVERLVAQINAHPEALHYCRLAFMNDGPAGVWLNAAGANMRSRWLGVPFGDQGFALSRTLFERVGGFDTGAAYGEDHLLVWSLRLAGVPLCGCPQPLYTSARKYRQQGWRRLTLRYQWLWLRQAWPLWWRWVSGISPAADPR